jgi:hypothetical protein
LIIDGVVLPRGTDAVAKPATGTTTNVLVRADKHEDTLVMIDATSPDEVEVTLIPLAPGSTATGSPAAPGSATMGRRHRIDAGIPKDPSNDPPPVDAPPNPYE